MSAPTFLQTLGHEVGLLQAQYPDRADEVSRACALITMGSRGRVSGAGMSLTGRTSRRPPRRMVSEAVPPIGRVAKR